jgi:hypothetical protein
MGSYLQILAFVTIGIVLFWLGYSLFYGPFSSFSPNFFTMKKRYKSTETGEPGDPQICPVCSVRLERGQLVKSQAFPSISGGKDRLMYIRGCYCCLEEGSPRRCPVCGITLGINDFLISRMFERSKRHNHVHVLGCNYCKRVGSLMR